MSSFRRSVAQKAEKHIRTAPSGVQEWVAAMTRALLHSTAQVRFLVARLGAGSHQNKPGKRQSVVQSPVETSWSCSTTFGRR